MTQLLRAALAFSVIACGSACGTDVHTHDPLEQAGWPDATTTGYRNAPGYSGSLTPWPGGPIASNSTYVGYDFSGGIGVGTRDAAVTDVTFIGCRFHGAAPSSPLVPLFGTGITFDHCSFEPASSSTPVALADAYWMGLAAYGGFFTHVGALEVTHCDFWGFMDAIVVQGSTQGEPQVFADNWIHDAAEGNGSVNIAGLSVSDAQSYMTIRHNVISSRGNIRALDVQSGPSDHLTITDNLFGGFGYTVALVNTTDTAFTGNTNTTAIAPTTGPLYGWESGSNNIWSANLWSVPADAAWGSIEHDGWFRLPVTGAIIGGDDTPFVSLTDYSGN